MIAVALGLILFDWRVVTWAAWFLVWSIELVTALLRRRTGWLTRFDISRGDRPLSYWAMCLALLALATAAFFILLDELNRGSAL